MYALVLVVLAAVRWWNHRGPARLQPVTGPLFAAGLLALGAAAGLSRTELGLGGSSATSAWFAAGAVAVVALGYGVALLVPAGRRAFLDPRHRVPLGRALRTALIGVPLATVVFEEIAFRGVLWGLLPGDLVATAVTAVLFGLWHLPRLRDVLVTTLAGVVLGLLRDAGGNVLAPIALHWAANGLGVIVSALLWAYRNGETLRKPDVA